MEFNEFVNTYRDVIKETSVKNELEMEYEMSYGKDWKQSFLKRDMFEMECNERLRRLYKIKIMFDSEFGDSDIDNYKYISAISDYVEYKNVVYRENRSQGGGASTYGGYLSTLEVDITSDLGKCLIEKYGIKV